MNFIEQYWGSVKLQFRAMEHTTTMEEMEAKVVECLDDVPLLHIGGLFFPFFCLFFSNLILIRFANQSAQLMSAYAKGLTSVQASWANRKYHGHRTLPPEMVAYINRLSCIILL